MIALIALLLASVPLTMTLGNLLVYRRPRLATGRPSLSVLIPARNEEANIGAAARAVLASEGVDIELVVLDDHSTDRTAAILAAIPDARLRMVTADPLPPGWSGKQHACAQLGKLARHELMVFVDADVRLAPDAISRMAAYMQLHDVGLSSGVPHQVVRSWSEQLLLPLIHFLLLGFLPIFAMSRSASPALGAACGQLIVVRRDAYLRTGGHGAIHASLHDGLMLARAFRQAGFKTGLFDCDRFATCRMYSNAAEVWEGLMKNATEGMAKPIALPVWTVLLAGGQILPFLLLPDRLAMVAVAGVLVTRLLLAWRFRQPIISALLHPFGVLALLVVQWSALVRAARGRPSTWRGRSYPAQ
jgi:hypothetical protein